MSQSSFFVASLLVSRLIAPVGRGARVGASGRLSNRSPPLPFMSRSSSSSSSSGGAAASGGGGATEGYKKAVNSVFRANFVPLMHLIAMGITLNVSIYAYNYQKKLKVFETEYETLKENDKQFVETFSNESFFEELEKEVKSSTTNSPIIAERILAKMNISLKRKEDIERKIYNVPTSTPIETGEESKDSKTRMI